jgi:hypothetical protein
MQVHGLSQKVKSVLYLVTDLVPIICEFNLI